MGWEILLTRLASLRYHFHFGHLAVSNGMLGVGVAATWLGVNRRRWAEAPMTLLQPLLSINMVVLAAAIAVLYLLPVHLSTMDAEGVASFAVFATASLGPFLTCGAVMGLLLGAWPQDVSRIYGADLLAAGAACLWVPMALPSLGMAGAITLIVLCTIGAHAVIQTRRLPLSAALAITTVLVGQLLPLAPSKITRPVLSSTWTPISRVDLVSVNQPSIRARGRPIDPSAIPDQIEIMQDGSASTLLSNHSASSDWPDALEDTLFSASARLRPGARVMVIGFGGGDDVWAVLGQGATSVDAVDLHQPVLDAHRVHRPEWSARLLQHPGVQLRVSEGRHALKRSDADFDIVQMTGIDTWAALSSGAFMLAENHLYTTDAFGEMIERLAPGGILQITRMAAEMEALRVLVQLRVAHEARSDVPFSTAVMALGSQDHQVATLLSPGGFTEAEAVTLHSWAEAAGFRVLYTPHRPYVGLIAEFIQTDEPDRFIAGFPRLITPTFDESPYFFQFTRWTQPDRALQSIKEPTYISQGNPMWVLGLGGYTLAVAAFLLLFVSRRSESRPTKTLYFAGIGMGYVMVELGLMHKLSLLLGHPMLSFSVVLGAMLLSSGVASLLAHRLSTIRWLALTLGVLVLALHLALPEITDWAVQLPTPLRVVVGWTLCVPIGGLLGLPMVYGLRRIPQESIPWAWATNALFSVAGATLVILVSMTWSFSGVWVVGALAYSLAVLDAPASDALAT